MFSTKVLAVDVTMFIKTKDYTYILGYMALNTFFDSFGWGNVYFGFGENKYMIENKDIVITDEITSMSREEESQRYHSHIARYNLGIRFHSHNRFDISYFSDKSEKDKLFTAEVKALSCYYNFGTSDGLYTAIGIANVKLNMNETSSTYATHIDDTALLLKIGFEFKMNNHIAIDLGHTVYMISDQFEYDYKDSSRKGTSRPYLNNTYLSINLTF